MKYVAAADKSNDNNVFIYNLQKKKMEIMSKLNSSFPEKTIIPNFPSFALLNPSFRNNTWVKIYQS